MVLFACVALARNLQLHTHQRETERNVTGLITGDKRRIHQLSRTEGAGTGARKMSW